MKMLLSTTAIMAAIGFSSMALAETTAPKANPATAQDGVNMTGFLANRGQSDVFVSELMGQNVYARRTPAAGQTNDDQANRTSTNLGMMTAADLDGMDNIGQINEIVLSHDGQVRAIVIGIGGFLGVGEQDVAVTMDQVTFATNAEDRSEIYVVVNTGADLLQNSPRYERSAMMEDRAMGVDAPAGKRTAFVAPTVERDGYTRVAMTEMSSEMLVGKSVYGVNDNSVGTIDDLILDDQGAITNVIIDFGGFLGMGTSQVSVGFDELTILADEGRSDFRVYVDATREQIQAQPQYEAMN